LVAVVRVLDPKRNRAMLVGHPPESSDLAHRLSIEIIDTRTSAVVGFDFESKA
jgi:phosphohistidine phosphatase SixA